MGYHSARAVYLRVMHDRMCEIPKWHLLAYNSSGEMFELVQNHIFKLVSFTTRRTSVPGARLIFGSDNLSVKFVYLNSFKCRHIM